MVMRCPRKGASQWGGSGMVIILIVSLVGGLWLAVGCANETPFEPVDTDDLTSPCEGIGVIGGTWTATQVRYGHTFEITLDMVAQDECNYTYDYRRHLVEPEHDNVLAYRTTGRMKIREVRVEDGIVDFDFLRMQMYLEELREDGSRKILTDSFIFPLKTGMVWGDNMFLLDIQLKRTVE